MIRLVLALIPLAFLISMPVTALLVRLGHRLKTYDSAGVPGQMKAERRRVPNTGGIAIFLGIAAPILVLLVVSVLGAPKGASPDVPRNESPGLIPDALREHMPGIRAQAPLAILVLGSMLLLHILGLVDDRRPLGPRLKLCIMALPALAVPLVTTLVPGLSETRLLTMLDAHAGGPWLSILITAMWIIVVTNAMNFMDNMDGLTAGTAAVAGSAFLAATLVRAEPQWFIAACLALLVGACLGFLVFNAPRQRGARIFMGDGGSLILGFLLAFLTVRTTYLPETGASMASGHWYALLMPLVVLAVPLYDCASVVIIRLSQGRRLFVGDLQHLSHRLVQRGLSKPAAVIVIWGATAITGIAGISLADLAPWQAMLAGAQVLLMLLLLALFEWASTGTKT